MGLINAITKIEELEAEGIVLTEDICQLDEFSLFKIFIITLDVLNNKF